MSLKELNDNWEKQYIGTQFTKRLQQRLLAEHTERMRREVNRRIFESVVVSVLDKRGRVKGIGLNEPQDLILDNFGKLLAALIRAPSTADLERSLVKGDGAASAVNVFRNACVFCNNDHGAVGTRLRVGSEATDPTRSDYNITTPFATAPESGLFDTGTGSYSVGVISFSGAITAGGSGTIRETGFFARWLHYCIAPEDYMLFHDLVSAVGFVAGNTITVAYTINL